MRTKFANLLKLALLIGAVSCCLFLSSCKDAGTLKNVDEGNNPNIEVYKYYFASDEYVYIARFKDCPQVQTTTWKQRQGKVTHTKGNVVIYENDSIQVILK